MAPHVDNTYLLDYKWIVVIACFGAFYTAWGIGANDLANSFGTSVGSKTLKIWQACVIAGIFEFLGAFFLGSTVVDTVSSKIASVPSFANRPELYMYGMMCVDYASALWLNIATVLELPVSTTHSTIGGVIGFALVNGGRDGVIWNEHIPDFPYRKGVTPIVISWFTSPLIAAGFGGFMFFLVRTFILRRKQSLFLGYLLVPFIFFAVVMINVVYVISKGAKFLINKDNAPLKATCVAELNAHTRDPDSYEGKCIRRSNIIKDYFPYASAAQKVYLNADGSIPLFSGKPYAYPSNATKYCCRKINIFNQKGWMSPSGPAALAGAIVAILSAFWIWFYIRPRIDRYVEEMNRKLAIDEAKEVADAEKKAEGSSEDDSPRKEHKEKTVEEIIAEVPRPTSIKEWPMYWIRTKGRRLMHKVFGGLTYDIHAITSKDNNEFDEVVYNMHQLSEKFDPATEKLFEYLQVFSACAMAFAHGSNDVANAVGPFAGVWSVYKFKRLNPKSADIGDDMRWILGLGGAGIVIGLATYGHVIMRGLGVKLARITPSRGFCMETSTGITVTFASAYGLPVSTTHCQVGSTSGVGAVDNWRTGINYKYLGKAFLGWVITLIITAHLCAALYSQGAYAPNVYMVVDRVRYQQFIGATVTKISTTLAGINNATLTNWGLDKDVVAKSIKSLNNENLWLNLNRISSTSTDGKITKNETKTSLPFYSVQYFDAGDEKKILDLLSNITVTILSKTPRV